MKRRLCLSLAIVLISTPLFAPIYMKLSSVNGDAQDPAHKGWIEIESFSWGASQTAAGPGAGPHCSLHELSFIRRESASSLKLFQVCNSHTPVDSLTFDANGERHQFQNVGFKSCQSQTLGDGSVRETFTLSFTRCATHEGGPRTNQIKEKLPPSNASMILGNLAPERFALSELKLDRPNHGVLIALQPPRPSKGLIILQRGASSHEKFPTLNLETRGGNWKFTDVMISSYSTEQRGGQTYAKIEFSYVTMDGSVRGFQDLEQKV